ncbi:MAG TPA: LPS export ABC transporter permease LptG [Spongiibacteraceae bacterium]|nr:LPS export ABC transporter permease LptG [Spongiibacteraceae bacterium]
MRLITRYVARQVTAAILLVLAVLLGLDLIIGLLDQTGDMQGKYTLGPAAYYTALTLPSHLAQLLPFSVLIGCLAGLGALATTSELVVMRSAGVSVARIVWMALRPALIVTLFGLLIAEFVAPKCQQAAQSYRAMLLQKKDISISEYGLWHREGNRFIHFNAVQPNGELFGVSIFELDPLRRLSSAAFAQRAIFQEDHWLLEDVRTTRFLGDRVESSSAPRERWDTQLSPQLLNILVLNPVDLSISGLWRYVYFLKAQGSTAGQYELALWNKVLQPLAVISLVLVAASIIFGPQRQASMGTRVFTGLMIGVVFRISQDMLGPASLVFGFAPILASLLPILVSLVAGFLFLRRR